MASVALSYYCQTRSRPNTDIITRKRPKILTIQSCLSRDGSNAQEKKEEMMMMGGRFEFLNLLKGFERIGRQVKKNLSPQQKGDWKDLLLMSLSFAVYVYISQKLVCAYCAWTSIPKQPW